MRKLFGISACRSTNDRFHQKVLFPNRESIQHTVRYHNNKISVFQRSLHRFDFNGVHDPDRQTGRTDTLHFVSFFDKCGRSSCFDQTTFSCIQIKHAQIHRGKMDFLTPHHQCRIDHLNRRLCRKSGFQQLFQQFHDKRTLPACLLSGSHSIGKRHCQFSSAKLTHHEIIT